MFATTQTIQYQPLFRWVGFIVDNNWSWVFLRRAKSNIVLKKLDDAKKYRVGGYRVDAVALYLESKDFRIDDVPKDYLNSRKLDRGRIDLWATEQLLGFITRRRTASKTEKKRSFVIKRLCLPHLI